MLATQNPIEQEGTYPLPEAQLDRFMFLIEVDYPTEEEEMRIARETTGTRSEELKHILSGEEIIFTRIWCAAFPFRNIFTSMP